MLYLSEMRISAVTRSPSLRGSQVWCNTVGKFLNNFEQWDHVFTDSGPHKFCSDLRWTIPVISNMHIKKIMFLETLREKTSKIALVF